MDSLFQVKKLFFDRDAVKKAMSDASRRALSKGGAFVRTRAKTSIKKRKSISQPGKPPSSHTDKLKRLIFFAYDPSTMSAVIGPTPFGEGKAPRLLEKGGSVNGDGRSIFITNAIGRDASTGKFVSNGKTKVTLTGVINYKPRPFMGPAMTAEQNAGTFANCFKDSIRK